MKNLKSILLICSLLSTAVLLSCSKDGPSISTDDNSPNIILIIADDLGWDVFGNYPGTNGIKAHTPTLDSLANEGVTFLNFWSNPLCAPTRAALLTGKYGFRTGVGGAQTPQTATLSTAETILQKYIADNTANSYVSAVIGKWHVNASTEVTAPEDFGVDFYSGILRGAVTDYYNWPQTSGGMQENITTYTTTHFVNQSIDWIEEQSKPFFLWLAFNAPHTPFHRPPLTLISDQSLSDNQSEIDANPLPYYLASVEAMDSEIARLIASLSPEQKENTIFIFLGDNGTPTQVGQEPFISTGFKNTLFQGGINVPLIISGKGITRRNQNEHALFHLPDLTATIAGLAGVEVENYHDGTNMESLLINANVAKRTFIYTEQFGNTRSDNDGYAIRNEDYKLIHLENGTEYFFHLSSDPFEQRNLLNEPLSAEAQQNLEALMQIKNNL